MSLLVVAVEMAYRVYSTVARQETVFNSSYNGERLTIQRMNTQILGGTHVVKEHHFSFSWKSLVIISKIAQHF